MIESRISTVPSALSLRVHKKFDSLQASGLSIRKKRTLTSGFRPRESSKAPSDSSSSPSEPLKSLIDSFSGRSLKGLSGRFVIDKSSSSATVSIFTVTTSVFVSVPSAFVSSVSIIKLFSRFLPIPKMKYKIPFMRIPVSWLTEKQVTARIFNWWNTGFLIEWPEKTIKDVLDAELNMHKWHFGFTDTKYYWMGNVYFSHSSWSFKIHFCTAWTSFLDQTTNGDYSLC